MLFCPLVWCSLQHQQQADISCTRKNSGREFRPTPLHSSHVCDPTQRIASRAVLSPGRSPVQLDGSPMLLSLIHI